MAGMLAGLLHKLREGGWGKCNLCGGGEGTGGVRGTQEHVADLPCLPQSTQQGPVHRGRVVPHCVLSCKEHTRPREREREGGEGERERESSRLWERQYWMFQ